MKNRVITLFVLAALFISLAAFQIIKTQIHLTIRNELGNTEEGVRVRLFETESDYTKEENVAAEGTTDEKGVVRFKELKAIPYYVLAEKGDLNNFGGGEQTGKLEEKRINKVTVIIN